MSKAWTNGGFTLTPFSWQKHSRICTKKTWHHNNKKIVRCISLLSGNQLCCCATYTMMQQCLWRTRNSQKSNKFGLSDQKEKNLIQQHEVPIIYLYFIPWWQTFDKVLRNSVPCMQFPKRILGKQIGLLQLMLKGYQMGLQKYPQFSTITLVTPLYFRGSVFRLSCTTSEKEYGILQYNFPLNPIHC